MVIILLDNYAKVFQKSKKLMYKMCDAVNVPISRKDRKQFYRCKRRNTFIGASVVRSACSSWLPYSRQMVSTSRNGPGKHASIACMDISIDIPLNGVSFRSGWCLVRTKISDETEKCRRFETFTSRGGPRYIGTRSPRRTATCLFKRCNHWCIVGFWWISCFSYDS